MTLADRAATWHQAHQELVAASSVLVIGGGLVGVELAAEIAVALPHIAVSLVHPRADLCQELPPPAREYVLHFLRKHSVQVHLGRRVANMSVGDDEHDGECMLDDGTLLSYSLAYRCTAIVQVDTGDRRSDLKLMGAMLCVCICSSILSMDDRS